MGVGLNFGLPVLVIPPGCLVGGFGVALVLIGVDICFGVNFWTLAGGLDGLRVDFRFRLIPWLCPSSISIKRGFPT